METLFRLPSMLLALCACYLCFADAVTALKDPVAGTIFMTPATIATTVYKNTAAPTSVSIVPTTISGTHTRGQFHLALSKAIPTTISSLLTSCLQVFETTTGWKLGVWEMVQITALCGALPGIWFVRRCLQGTSRNDSIASSTKSNSKLHPDISFNEDDSTG